MPADRLPLSSGVFDYAVHMFKKLNAEEVNAFPADRPWTFAIGEINAGMATGRFLKYKGVWRLGFGLGSY